MIAYIGKTKTDCYYIHFGSTRRTREMIQSAATTYEVLDDGSIKFSIDSDNVHLGTASAIEEWLATDSV